MCVYVCVCVRALTWRVSECLSEHRQVKVESSLLQFDQSGEEELRVLIMFPSDRQREEEEEEEEEEDEEEEEEEEEEEGIIRVKACVLLL